jgi:hypothetical protein
MRVSRLAEWVAGGVAGCPGTVDTTAPDDSPTPTPEPQYGAVSVADPSTRQRPCRSRWITAAAVILIVFGGLGIVYAPFLTGGAVWTFLGVGVSTLTILAVLNIVTGIGLLRLSAWARIAAGLLSAVGLLLLHAPALMAAVAHGDWSGIDWLGIAGSLVVLFAVLRRWPAEPVGAD